jgi:dCTP deaminase
VAQSSYELSLGAEAFLSGASQKTFLDRPGAQLQIPPGQFALLITEETIQIPQYAIGFISLKSKAKFAGIINASGFHVDPGFRGRLVFSVYNAGPQPYAVACGDPLFLLWYADLDGPTRDLYHGSHQDQLTIGAEYTRGVLGKVASPAELARRLDSLENWRGVLVGLLASLLTALLIFFLSFVPPILSSEDPDSRSSVPEKPALAPSPASASTDYLRPRASGA